MCYDSCGKKEASAFVHCTAGTVKPKKGQAKAGQGWIGDKKPGCVGDFAGRSLNRV